MKEYSNASFGVDDYALFSAHGPWHVPLDRVAHMHDVQVLWHVMRAAIDLPHVPLDDIEAAFRHAIKRVKGGSVDWPQTMERAGMIRRAWPIIAEGCRKVVAGETVTEQKGGAPKPAAECG